MAKVKISDLIANDMIHYGIDSTSGFQYIVSLDDYTSDLDEETKDYIYNHLEEIEDSITKNENIADLYYDEKEKSFDMVFYLDSVFDRVEKRVYNTGRIFDLDLSVENVKDIAEDVLNADALNDDITNRVRNCDKGMEY
jgi:hypothetical protein